MTVQRFASIDKSQLRTCAIALDTEAENMTDQMGLAFRDQRTYRALNERRAKLWHAAKLLREIADGGK